MSKAKEMEKDKDGVITDKRFVHLHSDPRFMRLPKNNLKVSIDSRFQRMFSDSNFSEALAFDKRGRPIKKKHKSKLQDYYYHPDLDEENEENANSNAATDNEDKTVTHSDGDINDEKGLLQSEKNKKKKKKKHVEKNDIVVNRDDQGHDVLEGDDATLGKVTGSSDGQRKEKKKNKDTQMKKKDTSLKKTGTQLNKKEGQLKDKDKKWDEAMCVDGGVEDKEETQLKKMKKKKKKNEMNEALVDVNEILHKEEGGIKSERVGAMTVKNRKKNEASTGLDKNLFIDETGDDNRFVQPRKSKKKTKVNTGTDDLERDMYKGKDDGDARVEEEEGFKASKRTKRKLKKMKDGKNGKNLFVKDELDFLNECQTETNNEDEKDQGEEQYSFFEEGKKENAAVEVLQEQHDISDDGGESSESQSSSDEDLVMSQSEESETSSSSDDDYQIDMPESPKEEVPIVDSETRRLAAVNMDWNHIKAIDLLVVMNSFLPKGGRILSVSVYPSEFGLQQMAEEAVHGPALFGSDDESSEDDENELDNEKLRQYEKARLRYYFAVIECDSSATADYLYKACDGVEFERTSNAMDLRFIPDDMEFNHPSRDVATEVSTSYEAPDFHTRALQHSKVNISWDDDEPLRVKTLHRKYDPKKLNEMDFKDYLASDDDASDNDEDNEDENVADDEKKKKGLREKYRSLLESGDPSEGEEDKDDKDMEITFNTGLEELSKRILEKSKKNNSEETVWEAYLRKRKEKRKSRKKMAKGSSEDESGSSDRENIVSEHQDDESDDFFLDDDTLDNEEKNGLTGSMLEKSGKKQSKLKSLPRETKGDEDASKAELELLLADEHGLENGVRGYNLKPKKIKGRKQKEYPSEDKLPTVDYDDPRFSALFKSHHFAIDPTDPQFKRSATYSRSIVQKQQKKFADKTTNNLKTIVQEKYKMDESKLDDSSNKKRKIELSSLIKSVKRKVGTLQS